MLEFILSSTIRTSGQICHWLRAVFGIIIHSKKVLVSDRILLDLVLYIYLALVLVHMHLVDFIANVVIIIVYDIICITS